MEKMKALLLKTVRIGGREVPLVAIVAVVVAVLIIAIATGQGGGVIESGDA
jgi:hypothetical protein